MIHNLINITTTIILMVNMLILLDINRKVAKINSTQLDHPTPPKPKITPNIPHPFDTEQKIGKDNQTSTKNIIVPKTPDQIRNEKYEQIKNEGKNYGHINQR